MERPFSKGTTVAVTVFLLFLQIICMDLIGCSSAQPIELFQPSGYQSYFVLGNNSLMIMEWVSNYGEGLVSRDWSGHDARANDGKIDTPL